MGNKYTIVTFYIGEGEKTHSGHESLIATFWHVWKLRRLKRYGCISIEIR